MKLAVKTSISMTAIFNQVLAICISDGSKIVLSIYKLS